MLGIPKIPKEDFVWFSESVGGDLTLGRTDIDSLSAEYGSIPLVELERKLQKAVGDDFLTFSPAYTLARQVADSHGGPSPAVMARLSFIAAIADDPTAVRRYDVASFGSKETAPISTDEIQLSLGKKQTGLAAAEQLRASIKGESILADNPWMAIDTVYRVDTTADYEKFRSLYSQKSQLKPIHESTFWTTAVGKNKVSLARLDELDAMKDELSPLGAEFMEKTMSIGHDFAALRNLFNEIKDKSDDWLRANLTGLDLNRGRGIAQQLASSCAASSVQLIRAQLDPIYVLELRRANIDVTARWSGAITGEMYRDGVKDAQGPNGPLVREQERLSRTATADNPRANASRMIHLWQSEFIDPSFPGISDVNAALKDAFSDLPIRISASNFIAEGDESWLELADAYLKTGTPVLLTTTDPKGEAVHGMTLLDSVSDAEGRTRYLVHDPCSGNLFFFKPEDMRKREINIGVPMIIREYYVIDVS